jgi:lipopolysaccharide export LptBFGC system permease protein LptF
MGMTKEDIRESFYIVDGFYHTNIFEISDYEIDKVLIHETLLDMLIEDEVLFVFGDEIIDNSTGFILYRKNNRLLMEYIFKENDSYVLLIDGCAWVYPKYKIFQFHEKADLSLKLEEYIQYNSLNLSIQGMNKDVKKNLYQSEKDSLLLDEKQVKRVKLLAYFWRYGFLPFIPLFMVGGAFLFNNEYGMLIGMSTFLLIMAIYLLMGAIFRFRHIYCMYQNANHQEMTPNKIYWISMKNSDIYGVPIIFIIIAIAGLIVGILGIYGIIR